MQRCPDGILFRFAAQTKTQRGGPPKEFFASQFDEEPALCPVHCLTEHVQKTKDNRSLVPDAQPLLLITHYPFSATTPSTVSRWIKTALVTCGVDTSVFKANSTRGALSSVA